MTPAPSLLETAPATAHRTTSQPAPRTRDTSYPVLAWGCRLLLGSLLAMSYLGSVVVFGWLSRWVQGQVLHGWWRRSPQRGTSFESFCAEQPDTPCLLPRLLFRERFSSAAPSGVSSLFRSLWLNLRFGVVGLFGTFLLVGWGCLLLTFSWEYGWNASFHKVYEQRMVGKVLALAGTILFCSAMVYVPMAQVHQAVTGDFRAFFELRFIGQLIRARLGRYTFFAVLFLVVAIIVENLKTIPTGLDDHVPFFINASDKELLRFLQVYYFGCNLFLLVSLLATRLVLLRLYRGAVIDVLRRGWVKRDDLHPRIADWFTRLELFPEARRGAERVRLGRLASRAALIMVLLAAWVGFVAKVYVGEFFNYHPVVGFLNHPMIQAPCCSYIPSHLGSAEEDRAAP